MKRVLTFAEFANSLDQNGPNLGNSQADVDALAASTDQFTADGESSCDDGGHADQPEKVGQNGEKVIVLASGSNHDNGLENNDSEDTSFNSEEDAEDEENALDFETPEEDLEEF